jgi:hypothetical protein
MWCIAVTVFVVGIFVRRSFRYKRNEMYLATVACPFNIVVKQSKPGVNQNNQLIGELNTA